MNWIDIDNNIISMLKIYTDKELLYKDVKKLYKWNDSQVEHAVGPLLERWDWYNKMADNKSDISPNTKRKKEKK